MSSLATLISSEPESTSSPPVEMTFLEWRDRNVQEIRIVKMREEEKSRQDSAQTPRKKRKTSRASSAPPRKSQQISNRPSPGPSYVEDCSGDEEEEEDEKDPDYQEEEGDTDDEDEDTEERAKQKQSLFTVSPADHNIINVNGSEPMEIEDIIAQFEESSAGGQRTVSCPSCKKCFVSSQFLNMHIANTATMCDLCNTQCCSQLNLRNHKNLECDLSKRKRNIDMIAKYECSLCGKYVKILDSHMRFVHGMEAGARGDKFRCPECSVLVSDLETHIERRHGDNVDKIVVEEDINGEVVRCRHPGCDLFFNNAEEVAEHIKREHTEEVSRCL